MQIKELFAKDIDRPINGVIKIAQDDDATISQELDEYVVTTELQRHFDDFLESYDGAIDTPTDRIGVWISGFFGSGKSHFLKMLSYVLANREVAGKRAIDFFEGKLENPLVDSKLHRAAGVPTESILFNIDSKGGHWKEGDTAKTALLRAFERVFYEHRGFFGEDLKLAKLEEYIDEQGKTQEFREAFERANGEPWVEARPQYSFFEDDVVDALVEALGMSRDAAQHWFDGTEDDAIAPDAFAQQVADYAERRAREEGGDFRLLFMADEVGQFIGSDVNLMLNLQTLVEEFGSRGNGRVWVMVTSQEALDEVVMVVGHDFSKIMGRFNTRLSLSSSSVDEVIKRRVLDKTPAAAEVLRGEYAEQSAVLKNLFAFEQSQSDLHGFSSDADFAATFPFVGYQFKVLPNVMNEIRKRGTSAKHMSTGERSMLSAFQESAQQVEDRGLEALVPFHLFFDTIAKDLEHGIINVVDRAGKAAAAEQGLSLQDVQVLKILYLIRYVGDVKATAGNVAILMIDDMGCDFAVLRENVKASLDRLVNENYVARQGDIYNFLTDEEQDIAREIANTQLDAAEIVENIKRVIFDGIYTQRKHRKGANDYPVDRYVDDTVHGQPSGGMKLNVITYAHDLARATEGELAVKSAEQAIVVLSDESDYYRVIENAAKIRKYVRMRNVTQLPPSTQDIVKRKQAEASAAEKEAGALLEDALVHARCAVAGRMIAPRVTKATQLIEAVLDELVGAVFTRADLIDAPVQGDADIAKILSGNVQEALGGTGGMNERACADVEMLLETNKRTLQTSTMGDLQRRYQSKPYGWREVDVAAVVARLIQEQRAAASIGGARLAAGDRKLIENLRGRGADQLVIEQREILDSILLKRARSIMADFAPGVAAPDDEDGLVAAVKQALHDARDRCQELIRDAYDKQPDGYPYPGRDTVGEGAHVIGEVLANESDPIALLNAFKNAENDLLDFKEDMERVEGFFPNQQRLFDASAKLLAMMREERVYFEANQPAQDAIAKIDEILKLSEPYGRIQELNALNQELESIHRDALAVRRDDLLAGMDNALSEVREYIEDARKAHPEASLALALDNAEQSTARRKNDAHNAQTLTKLDALSAQLDAWRDNQVAAVDQACAAVSADGSGEPAQSKVATLRREEVCPVKRLSTEQDVDAYVEAIRAKLLDALSDNDSVRIG